MRILVALALLSLAVPKTAQESPLRGFSPSAALVELGWESKAKDLPQPARMREYARKMAAAPHLAGSPASRAIAEYAHGLMKNWGLDADIEVFEALLPYPTERLLEMTAPVRYQAKLREPAIPEDPDSSQPGQIPAYNAYSASGDVTAQLVYVNYGIPEDYATLRKLGIDVRGKIVIARYGKSWRGTKPKVAAENGAVACIIYSDPRDDGYFQGDIYPKGPYRPPASAQRGSVMDMPLYVGDPLSPGWASEPGSRRLALSEARTLMKIPVLPVSYEDATPFLRNLGGPVAPEPWRGALPLTYHTGPGPATAHIRLDFDWTTKPLYNVVATIRGSELPDQWVIYGNHHDAWVNGASDPVSGASVVLETGRVLAELGRAGWKPRRTVKLALWDGEEFGLIGSTEWAEKHLQELENKAAVYLNTDSTGRGNLAAGGSPVLQTFLAEVLRDVRDPQNGKTLLEGAREQRAGGNGPSGLRLGPLGAGSDYVAFVHRAGVASLNLGFSGDPPGVYHSIYDSTNWYGRFSDGEFKHGAVMAQVMACSLMRLASSTVFPFEFGAFAAAVSGYIEEIRKQAGNNAAKVPFDQLRAEVKRVETAAGEYEAALAAALPRLQPADSGRISEAVFRTERALTLAAGLAGREWYRNHITAPGTYTGYSAKTLPGVREAVEAGRWDDARREAARVAEVLRAFAGKIGAAAAMLKDAGRRP